MSIDIKKLESISLDNSTPKEFAKARFELANECIKNNQIEKAKGYYLEIKRDYDTSIFTYSKFNLGIMLKKNRAYDDARKHLEEIQKSDDEYVYYKAQFVLGELFGFYLNDKDKSQRYFEETSKYFYYDSVVKLLSLYSSDNFKCIDNIYISVRKILSILKVKSDICVAHYTSPSVALSLFDKKDSSCLRLNTVKNVNDPTEGKILKRYLNTPSLDNRNNSVAFISCFTFNYDSLNQFRLYGKENNLESSGVSIVFNNGFFNNENDHVDFIDNVTENSKNYKNVINKLNLYRCIYIDPESNYVNISHRDKITFHKEKYEKNIKSYFNSIEDKVNNVIEQLKLIDKNIHYLSFEDKEYQNKLIDTLLLPISYLVKHAAFENEQECRIVYITTLKDERIKTYDNKFMYLDYEPKISEYVDRIYLSSGAYKYEDFFIRLLDGEDKIHLSKNPFRNKS